MKLIKTIIFKIKKFLPDYWKYLFVVYSRNIKGFSPIIVYQMGKVGSTTIYHTIKRNLNNPVFHVHFLRAEEITKIQNRYKDAGINSKPEHIRESLFLERFYWRDAILKWNIITLVREPITANLSHLFHNPRVHHLYLFDEKGNVDKNRALKIAFEKLMKFDEKKDYICNWLEKN